MRVIKEILEILYNDNDCILTHVRDIAFDSTSIKIANIPNFAICEISIWKRLNKL